MCIINLPSFLRSWELNVFNFYLDTTWFYDNFLTLRKNLSTVIRVSTLRLTRISPYISRILSFNLNRSSWSMSRMLRSRLLYCRNWWTSSAFCITCCWFSSSVCSRASEFVFLDTKASKEISKSFGNSGMNFRSYQ